MKYGFITEHEAQFGMSEMCAVLSVSRSGYYDWRGRAESDHAKQDRELLDVITELFNQERKKYGSPRIRKRLEELGRRHSGKRIARLMAQNGLFARKKKRRIITTQANPTHPHAPNLLNREFSAEQPNRKWVSDITQIPTQEGDVYLATTMDLYSRVPGLAGHDCRLGHGRTHGCIIDAPGIPYGCGSAMSAGSASRHVASF